MPVTSAIIDSSSARPTAIARAARLGVAEQPLDPQHERVAQALRRRAAAVEPGGEQLLGVERVALAALVQPLDQLLARRLAEDVGERLGQLVAVERVELDPPRAVEPVELGQQRPQRVPAVELVAAVGEHEHARARWRRLRARKATNVARRAVGPVHVLEHQHDGRLAR